MTTHQQENEDAQNRIKVIVWLAVILLGIVFFMAASLFGLHKCQKPPPAIPPPAILIQRTTSSATIPANVVIAVVKEKPRTCDPRKDWPKCGAVLYRNGIAERP